MNYVVKDLPEIKIIEVLLNFLLLRPVLVKVSLYYQNKESSEIRFKF